jgi:hypothetical protein
VGPPPSPSSPAPAEFAALAPTTAVVSLGEAAAAEKADTDASPAKLALSLLASSSSELRLTQQSSMRSELVSPPPEAVSLAGTLIPCLLGGRGGGGIEREFVLFFHKILFYVSSTSSRSPRQWSSARVAHILGGSHIPRGWSLKAMCIQALCSSSRGERRVS